jgi:hypothetical protein
MNLRIPCFAVALLSLAATGDPCDGGVSGTGSVPDYGPNGSVCSDLGVTCCGGVDDPCNDDNDCCTGNCSGANGANDGGGLGGSLESDAGSTCGEPFNEGCTIGLSSRCPMGACACTSDTDCCIGSCVTATIPGTSGMRCCLETGSPCDVNADCCSLTCTEAGQCQ